MRRIVGAILSTVLNAILDTQTCIDHMDKYLYHCEQPDPTDNKPNYTVDPSDFWAGICYCGNTRIFNSGMERPRDRTGASAQGQSLIGGSRRY